MGSFNARYEAAEALSSALTIQGIRHAFIGGFAVNLLGSTRETEDIDVEVDISDSIEMRRRVLNATASDPRFLQAGLKICFRPADESRPLIPIETLPAGQLGLPRELQVVRPGEGSIPVLEPGILVLTKIKRCVNFIGSTRPYSIVKLNQDLEDIIFILTWLHEQTKNVDFAGYHALEVERLYMAVKRLVSYWKEQKDDGLVELIQSVLTEEDQRKII